MDQEIRKLLDTAALTQLVARYARAVDLLDIPAMKACFSSEGVARFGTVEIPAHGFCDFWGNMGGTFKARHHMLGVPVIGFDGPDSAAVEAPAIVAGTKVGEGARPRDFMECNRYVFKAERRGDSWVFTDTLVFITWSQGAPTTTGTETGGALDHDVTIDHPALSPLPAW